MQYFKPIDLFFKDRNWYINIGLLALWTVLLVTIPVAIGYMVKVTDYARQGVDEFPQVSGNFSELFYEGIRFIVACLIYLVPFIICMIMAFAVPALIGKGEDAFLAFGILSLAVVVFLFIFAVCLACPALFIMAAEDKSFSFCVDFKRFFRIISEDVVTYVTVILVSALYSLIAGIGGSLIPLVGTLLIPLIANICMAHLYGQYARMQYERAGFGRNCGSGMGYAQEQPMQYGENYSAANNPEQNY